MTTSRAELFTNISRELTVESLAKLDWEYVGNRRYLFEFGRNRLDVGAEDFYDGFYINLNNEEVESIDAEKLYIALKSKAYSQLVEVIQ